MPLLSLEPKESIALSACKDRNPMASTVISNKSGSLGKYVISYDDMPLAVQYSLETGQSVTLCSPPGKITNDGEVDLEVSTPGL